ncbi:MAG: hypothetical protein MJA83_09845 [Gammaproteobacteria bacterium]|nr:hypothetical protein [Gammaproteobacteria bacterium]
MSDQPDAGNEWVRILLKQGISDTVIQDAIAAAKRWEQAVTENLYDPKSPLDPPAGGRLPTPDQGEDT